MTNARGAILPLAIILMLVIVPWAVTASDSDMKSNNGKGSDEESHLEMKVITNDNGIEYEIEFDNLTLYASYFYEIWFTRVDPDYVHYKTSDNITTEDQDEDYLADKVTLESSWTPPQDGPYTIHVTLSDSDGLLVCNGTDSFGWGDVWNNSASPQVTISATYDEMSQNVTGIFEEEGRNYLDIMNNETRQENIIIGFDAEKTEHNGDYEMKFRLYVVYDDASYSLIGMSVSTFHANYNMSTLNGSIGGWTEDTNYQFTLELSLNYGDENGKTPVAMTAYNFTIGIPPVTIIQGCTDGNATNYEPTANEDDGSCEYSDEDGDGVFDYLEIEGCTDFNATNFDENATEDDESCVFKDTDEDGVFDHLEIEGCTDQKATNYDRGATELDGSCVYPPPLSASISATPTVGEGPLLVSFEITITGGNSPYQVEWNLGDGTSSNQFEVEHVFSPGGYSVNVTVTDRDNRTATDIIPIIVSEPVTPPPLTGYIGHSGQLEPINEGMVATVEFTASATGGTGEYTYRWRFGDTGHTTAAQLEQLNSQNSEQVVIHEFAVGGSYTVTLTITDSDGEKFETNVIIEIVDPEKENEGAGIEEKPPQNGGVQELDLFIASTGGLCLLMLFGLTGRRRRKEKYLEKLRNEQMGDWGPTDDALWDEVDF